MISNKTKHARQRIARGKMNFSDNYDTNGCCFMMPQSFGEVHDIVTGSHNLKKNFGEKIIRYFQINDFIQNTFWVYDYNILAGKPLAA